MSHGRKFSLLVACIFCGFPAVSRSEAPVATEGPVAQVSRSLEELHDWLGNDDNARQWRTFLKSDALVEQLAKGNAADRSAIQEIRAVYSGSETGLDLRRFVAVRAALDKWLQELETPMTDLPAAARAAKETFRPISADDVARARARLETAVRQLDQYLQSSGAESAETWKQLIDWESLQQELAKSDGPRPDELERMIALYRGDEPGLEETPFAAVRQAMADYGHKLRLAADTKLQETYAQNLDELAKRLEALAAAPKSEDLAAAARALGWLERAGQTPQLVAATRSRFRRPNLFASASEKVIQASFDDPEARAKLNQPQGMRDNILGAAIHGTVYPSLELNVLLVPDDERATLNMQLNGGAASQNVGYKGPVTIYSSGYTQIAANKYIYLDADGVSSSRTSASCWTSSNIYDIAANCGLIKKMAWKQAAKKKGQAEQVASAHAQSRIAGQVDSQVNDRLADANQKFAEKFRNRLTRRDSFPRQLKLTSTEDAVHVRMLHASPNQLATPTDPPDLPGSHDLAVRMHETLVMNFGESLLGGETLTDERLVELLTESEAEVPEELKVTPDKDPWSITFSSVQPVSARFDDNRMKLAIHGRRFTRGDQVVRADIEISADYVLERQGNGSKLTRQGDVVAEYLNRTRLSVREVAMKTFLRKKFDALFKEEFKSDGLKLPERLKGIGTLKLNELRAEDGWLILAWQQAAASPQVAVAD